MEPTVDQNLDSLFAIGTATTLENRETAGSVPGGNKILFSLYGVQIGSEAPLVSYRMGTEGSSLGGEVTLERTSTPSIVCLLQCTAKSMTL